mmetsp:Transcript_29060/g.74748  ORF Transcript_29060/g.74748 Transcript_29060/m.74748 type:complete len:969 (-) Transcript_29060:1315-4221(-)
MDLVELRAREVVEGFDDRRVPILHGLPLDLLPLGLERAEPVVGQVVRELRRELPLLQDELLLGLHLGHALVQVFEDGERRELEDLLLVGRREAALAHVGERLAELEVLFFLGARLRQQRRLLAQHELEGLLRHHRDQPVLLARRLLPRESRLVEEQLVVGQLPLGGASGEAGVVPLLDEPPLGLVVEAVLLADVPDHVARARGLVHGHRRERAVHQRDAQEVLREDGRLLVEDGKRRLQRGDPLVGDGALRRGEEEDVLPRVQPELLPLLDLEELVGHLERLPLLALLLLVNLQLLLHLLQREEAQIERALLVLLLARVVVAQLAIVVQRHVPSLPAALEVLDGIVPRLLLAHVALLDDSRNLLVDGLVVLVAVEVDLHLVRVDQLGLVHRLLDAVAPLIEHLALALVDLDDDHVGSPQRPLDAPADRAERAHLVCVQLLLANDGEARRWFLARARRRRREHQVIVALHRRRLGRVALQLAGRQVVREHRVEGLMILEERERTLLERDVVLDGFRELADAHVEPPLVRHLELRHLHVLGLAFVVALDLDRLQLHTPPLAREADARLAVAVGVQDLEEDLAALLGRQVGVLRLAHVLKLLVREVRARVPLEHARRCAHLDVSAPNLPRLAESLEALDGALVAAVGGKVLEHAEEGLQVDHVLDDLVLAHLVELVDDLVVLQKEQRLAHAVLVGVDGELLEQQLAALGDRAGAQRGRVVGADAVVLVEVLERPAHVEARLADLRHLERARVRKLLKHEVVVPVSRLERLVRLEAADVVVLGGAQLLHERGERLGERLAHRLLLVTAAATAPARLRGGLGGGRVLLLLRVGLSELLELLKARVHLDERGDVGGELVLILLDEAFHRVHHLARVVRDHERLVRRLLGLDVGLVLGGRGARAERRVAVLEDGGVLARAGGAALVEEAEDAHGALGNQVDHVLVVLVRHEVPLDLLLDVDLLLELEDMLDEQVV